MSLKRPLLQCNGPSSLLEEVVAQGAMLARRPFSIGLFIRFQLCQRCQIVMLSIVLDVSKRASYIQFARFAMVVRAIRL